ncbi:MAG TPA: PRC-barrel domain-containing protein [Candidatus Tectomicrobia bacterium]|nr:PRC-barrel domain-containing protein [Candidatus Tectomicrobia bacterium]
MLRRVDDLRTYSVGAVDADIGSIEDVYFDDQSWTVRYFVVDTGRWLPGRKVLISPHSVRGLDPAGLRVVTDLTVQKVKDSPSIDTARPVSRQYEQEYSTYYGYPHYWLGPHRWGAAVYPGAVLGGPAYPPTTPDDYPPATEEMIARERESADPHLRSAAAVSGYGIRATDGELGHVQDFLADEQSWAIRYLIVDPRRWWPGPHVVVATDWVTRVDWHDRVVEVDVTRDEVRNAPPYDPTGALDRSFETRLYGHYARPGYWAREPEAWRRWPPAA